MKKIRSMVAVLLAAVMCFTMVPATAFADESGEDEGKAVNLLVFGNSTSSGYGMPDFYNTNNGFSTLNNYLEDWAAEADGFTVNGWAREVFHKTKDFTDETVWTKKAAEDWDNEVTYTDGDGTQHRDNPGLGKMSSSAYPWQLKKYIAQQDGVSKVNLIPICMNGMRTDELRAFLDEDFYQKASNREYEYARRWIEENNIENGDVENYKGFLNAHFDWYVGNFRGNRVIDERTNEAARAYIQDNIKNADVIVLDLCGNNFGTYMGYRLQSYLGMEDRYCANIYETIDDVDDMPEGLKSTLNSLKKTIQNRVPMLKEAAGEQLLDIYLYSVADCIVNFSADVELIREINPDAKIIAVGLNNPMEGLAIDVNGSSVDFGGLAGKLYDLVNTYIKAFDKNADNYYYAAIPSDMTTFASSIADAESFEELLADDGYALGAYAIESVYNGFVKKYLGGEDGDSQTVYGIIQSFIKNMAPNATFADWGNLSDNDFITFNPGTFYLTADSDKLLAATSQGDIFDAISFSPAEPSNNKFTKESVKIIATKIGMLNLSEEEQGPLVEAAIANGCITQDQITAFIYNYVYGSVGDTEVAGAYLQIQQGIKSKAPNASDFSELSDTECVTFKPGSLYVTFNTKEESILNAFDYSLTPELPGEGDDGYVEGKVLLTKGLLKQITAKSVKPLLQNMLYEAVRDHTTLDIVGLQTSLGDMGQTVGAISSYIAGLISGDEDAQLDDAYWQLLTIDERFLLDSGLGEHPNADGCDQKYQAVLKAYESDETAYDVTKEEILAMLEELKALLDQTPAGKDIDKIIALLDKIEQALPMIDEAQASLAEINVIKAQFVYYYGQALELLGITEDDLIAQGKFIADHIDAEQVAEYLKRMNDIIERWPELQEKYGPVVKEYSDKLIDFTFDAIDTLMAQKEFIEKYVDMDKVADAIAWLNDFIKEMPGYYEEYGPTVREYAKEIYDLLMPAIDELIEHKDEIIDAIDVKKAAELLEIAKDVYGMIDDVIKADSFEDKLDALEDIIVDKAGLISEDLYNQIKEIALKLSEQYGDKSLDEIMEELQPIFEQLKEIGLAVYNLPEYEKAVDAYAELLDQLAAENAELRDEVDSLKQQAAKLTAKSIRVKIAAPVTIANGEATMDVSWEKDADAAGYELKVNGQPVEYTQTETGFSYSQKVAIGETYKVEVTPYILYNDEIVLGRTYSETVVPKVTLKKAKIKKVKPATKSLKVSWKKVAKADGYRVYYKRAGKKAQYKNVKGGKKLKKTLKKLTSNKKYKVKVQAWKKVDGKKYFGKWSKAKSVKVK